jgi:hypothetical protein
MKMERCLPGGDAGKMLAHHQSAIRNPQSAIRNPQSIRNPQF